MSSSNDRKREERAFDLLIASQLGRERDIANPDDLPELTAEELAAMGSVPSDIIAQTMGPRGRRSKSGLSRPCRP